MTDLSPGTLLADRFEVERLVGSGGMGSVYRGLDKETGKPVALKILHHNQDEAVHASERFEREAQILSELRHPGIVSYIAHGRARDDSSFLAMEWLEGEDLAQRLQRGPLTLMDATTALTRAAEALRAAHDRGIVHRDLKPSNLFLRDGRVERLTLLDFGVARRVSDARPRVMTGTGVVVGTPSYMAPEQARGLRDVGPSADIFSLGCVLYECLTGQPPFAAEHMAAVFAKILFEEAPPARAIRPGVSPELDALLERMLTKDPGKRPKDAGALLAESATLRGLPPDSERLTTSGRPRALAAGEQLLISVVIALPLRAYGGDSPTLDAVTGQHLDAERKRLRLSIERLGARAEWLADGSLVASISAIGSATDQAAQAARIALLLQERWPDSRVGLATGRGVLRERMPVGEAIDKAVRLARARVAAALDPKAEQEGQPGRSDGVLVDEVTAGLLDARFFLAEEPLGVRLLRQREGDDETRVLLGKPTPCVGREQETGVLNAVLAGCVEESVARAVLVTGPPGMGKSRLRHEFLRHLRSRSAKVLVLIAHGDPMNAGSPYGLLSQALCRLCGIQSGEPPLVQQQKLEQRVAPRVPAEALSRIKEFLGELCGVPFPDENSVQLRAARSDPKIMDAQVRVAFLDWLRAECDEQPVLFILEDLHWGDALTVKLIDAALTALTEHPFMVLALARPEVTEQFPRLWFGRVQEIPLRGLSKRASERLARQVLGQEVDGGAIARIIAQADGNALFLEELVRAVAEGKGEALPQTVLAMLQARVLGLEPAARRLLRAASVYGETFWRGGVLALLGNPPETSEVERLLDALLEAELIEPHRSSRFPQDIEYGFRHALTRDAAYSLFTEADRALGHRLAGRHLARAGEADPGVLAEHAQKGGELDRAALLWGRAAELALGSYDLDATLRYAELALACGAQGEPLGILRALQASAHFYGGDITPAYGYALEALQLLEPNRVWWMKAVLVPFYSFFLLNKLERADELISAFAGSTPDPDARPAYLEAGCALMAFLANTGAREQAADIVKRMERTAADMDPAGCQFLILSDAWRLYSLEPEPYRALERARAGLALGRQNGDQRAVVFALFFTGVAYAGLGCFAEGEEALREGLSLARRLHERFLSLVLQGHLGLTLVIQPDAAKRAEALELSAGVIEHAHMGSPFLGVAHAILAEARLRAGDLLGAEAAVAIAMSAFTALSPYRFWVVVIRVRLLLEQGLVGEAHGVAEEGLADLNRLGSLGYCEVPLRLAVAQARFADGDKEAGRESLEEAARQARIRADSIPDADLRARFEALPENQRALAQAREKLP